MGWVEERVVLRVGYEWVISYFAPCLGVDGVCTADRNGGVVVMLASASSALRRVIDTKRRSNLCFPEKQGAPDTELAY